MVAKINFEDILKQGITEWNKWRKNNPDVKIKFRNAILSNRDLSSADFHNVDFCNANFNKSNLSRVNFQNAKLKYVNLVEATLKETDISGANFAGADLTKANMENIKNWEQVKSMSGAELKFITNYPVPFLKAALDRMGAQWKPSLQELQDEGRVRFRG